MPGDVLVDKDAMTGFLNRWFDARTRQEHLRRMGGEHPLPVDELDGLLQSVMETMRRPDGRPIHFVEL